MKTILLLAFGAVILSVSWAQNNSTEGRGFMNNINNWISRLRGQNNKDKPKDEDKNNQQNNIQPQQQQMAFGQQPIRYGMVPYPMVAGMNGMQGPAMYPINPMNPMAGFAAGPRPMGLSMAGPSFGSSMAGPSIGAGQLQAGASMSGGSPSLGGPTLQGTSFGTIDPAGFSAAGSASHIFPSVHHDYLTGQPSEFDYPSLSSFGGLPSFAAGHPFASQATSQIAEHAIPHEAYGAGPVGPGVGGHVGDHDDYPAYHR